MVDKEMFGGEIVQEGIGQEEDSVLHGPKISNNVYRSYCTPWYFLAMTEYIYVDN